MKPVAMVTVGARGIGRACALALAEHGFDLARLCELECIKGIALNRLGTPNDVAGLVAFLCNNKDMFITD